MTYRFIALVLLLLALFFGFAFTAASGVSLTVQKVLGYLVPLIATLPLALSWWRQTSRGW